MTPSPRQRKFERYEQAFEAPLILLTFLLLLIVVIRHIFDLSPTALFVVNGIDALIWVAFVVELIVLTSLAEQKIRFLITHWYDVAIVVLPVLRLTRLIRLVRLVRFQPVLLIISESSALARPMAALYKWFHGVRSFIIQHKFNYLIVFVVIAVLFLGALTAVFERRNPHANILSVEEGVWWSIVSITTVGYGDHYPVTLGGRMIAIILMTLGITTFSLLTAHIASFLVGEQDEEERRSMGRRLKKIEEGMDELTKELKKLNKVINERK